MPIYFLDTSALAKRYHRESGTEYMDRIFENPASRSLISHLSIVELESVLAIKTRTGEINETAVEIARRRFRIDVARERLMIAPPVHERHFHLARRLLIQYGAAQGLRTLDALQLAVALELYGLRQADVFVAADQRLCHIAALAGCPTINPEKPDPILA